MLLDRRSRPLALQQFDIGDNIHRLDAPEFTYPLPFTPAQESASGPRLGHPRVLVSDVNGEEFEEAERGLRPWPRDQRR